MPLKRIGYLLTMAIIGLSIEQPTAYAQLGAEYNCNLGQCLEANIHVINTPWINNTWIYVGWYDLGNGTRRLGFCANGVKSYAQSGLGYINVNSSGELPDDISFCGNSGVEKLSFWHQHDPENEPNYLQCGGTTSSNRLRPIKLNHDVLVSTMGGTGSDIDIWFSSFTPSSDAGAQFCGGSGADTVYTNVSGSFVMTGAGADKIYGYASGWFAGGDGNDELEMQQGPSTLCSGGSGNDTCTACDTIVQSDCETVIPF